MNNPPEPQRPCPGPLVWFDVQPDDAILLCVACGYIVMTGNENDEPHMWTDILREGLAQ